MKVRIHNKENGKLYSAAITRMNKKDFDKIVISKDFHVFKWDELRQNNGEIFKLAKGANILGLLQFFHEKKIFNIIELSKLESSRENVGSNKRYDKIAGCLIAFTCFQSLTKFTGEVFIFCTKKTRDIYLNSYGMQPWDDYYVKSDKKNSIRLVAEYLNIVM